MLIRFLAESLDENIDTTVLLKYASMLHMKLQPVAC